MILTKKINGNTDLLGARQSTVASTVLNNENIKEVIV